MKTKTSCSSNNYNNNINKSIFCIDNINTNTNLKSINRRIKRLVLLFLLTISIHNQKQNGGCHASAIDCVREPRPPLNGHVEFIGGEIQARLKCTNPKEDLPINARGVGSGVLVCDPKEHGKPYDFENVEMPKCLPKKNPTKIEMLLVASYDTKRKCPPEGHSERVTIGESIGKEMKVAVKIPDCIPTLNCSWEKLEIKCGDNFNEDDYKYEEDDDYNDDNDDKDDNNDDNDDDKDDNNDDNNDNTVNDNKDNTDNTTENQPENNNKIAVQTANANSNNNNNNNNNINDDNGDDDTNKKNKKKKKKKRKRDYDDYDEQKTSTDSHQVDVEQTLYIDYDPAVPIDSYRSSVKKLIDKAYPKTARALRNVKYEDYELIGLNWGEPTAAGCDKHMNTHGTELFRDFALACRGCGKNRYIDTDHTCFICPKNQHTLAPFADKCTKCPDASSYASTKDYQIDCLHIND